MEPHYDVVCRLIETPFCEWKWEDKQWAIKNGRPTPLFETELVMTKSRNHTSSPQPSLYKLFPWLCGSSYLKKFFCWPCLINRIESCEMDSVDFYNGTEQLLSLHEASLRHLKSAFRLIELQKQLQASDIPKDSLSINIVERHKTVLLNRRLMQLLIKTILLFTKQQLPLDGDDDSKTVSNHSNFNELLNLFVCESPLELQQQYSNIKTYLESEAIQKALVDCLCTHIIQFVKKEVSESLFYSIELDRVSHSHCSLIIRYVTADGLVVERPLGLLNIYKSCSPQEFFECLNAVLYPLKYQDKLVAQCYDGACVMREDLNELQSLVKTQVPQALFVYSYNHKFDDIIVQSLDDFPECRAFFTKLNYLPYFFNSSIKRWEALNSAIITKSGEEVVTLKNQFSTQYEILSAVNDGYLAFKNTFKSILSDPSFDDTSVRRANAYLKYFEDMEFIFLSLVFKFIFEVIRNLLDILQKNSGDVKSVFVEVDNIRVALTEQRTFSRFIYFYEKSKDRVEIGQKEYYKCKDVHEKFQRLYFKILDAISQLLDFRLKDSKNLKLICLTEWSVFKNFSKYIPDNSVQPLIELYPFVITDSDRIRNELELFYSVVPYKQYGIQEIIKKMNEDRSCEILKELYKLFSLIITLPYLDVSFNNHIFSPRRMLNCLKNSNHNGKFKKEFQASYMMLSLGQEVINHLTKTSLFYDAVIDLYVSLVGQTIPLILQK